MDMDICYVTCVPTLAERVLTLLIWGPPVLLVVHACAYRVVELITQCRDALRIDSPDLRRR